MTLTEAIIQTYEDWEFELEPWQINNGQCEEFAFAASGLFFKETGRRAEVVGGPWHTFIAYEDQYYDCEAPDGVDDPTDLPFYQRESAPRESWERLGWNYDEGHVTRGNAREI